MALSEKLYPELNLFVYQLTPESKNGISKYKVVELKSCLKISNTVIYNKERLAQELARWEDMKINRESFLYCSFYPFRATEEKAKEDLATYVELKLAMLERQIEENNKKLKKLNHFKKVAECKK
jgi:hypothetical protein